MKTLLLNLVLILTVITANAQSTSGNRLDINEHSVWINSSGYFFGKNGTSVTEIPKDSGQSCLYTHSLWVSVRDDYGALSLAGRTYGANGFDYWSGPIADNYDSIYDAKYDTVWKINKTDIDYHIANYTNTGYTQASAITSWPGNGNTANGESPSLAPYIDVNLNSTYDPENGDYPFIKGDQAIFTIFNDEREEHTETGGHKIGIEVHVMLYAFTNQNNTMDSTFFMSYRIFNRSIKNYSQVYIGSFTDADIGESANDLFGCKPDKNLVFTYNKGADGDGTLNTYGVNPPAIGEVFLNEDLDYFMYFDRLLGTQQSDPTVAVDFDNYLRCEWKDQTHLTYGGNGYGGTTPTNYAYPGNIHDSTQWIDVNRGDHRMLSTFNKGSFLISENFCFDMAYVFGRTQIEDHLQSVDIMFNNADIVLDSYNTHDVDCNFWPVNVAKLNKETHFTLYPNPTTGQIKIESDKTIEQVKIVSITGKVVKQLVINKEQLTIDLSAVAKGIYFVKLIGEGFVSTQKLVLE